MIRIAIIIFFVSALAFNGHSQKQHEKNIENRLNSFIELSNQKKWSEAFDMIYAGLFEVVGKHEIIGMMENMDREGFDMRTKEFEITKYSDLASSDEEDFVLVHYDSKQELKMPTSMMDDPAMRAAIIENMKSNMTGEVMYDEIAKSFQIELSKSIFAISDKGKEDWFLLENNAEQETIIAMLIPEEVRKVINP